MIYLGIAPLGVTVRRRSPSASSYQHGAALLHENRRPMSRVVAGLQQISSYALGCGKVDRASQSSQSHAGQTHVTIRRPAGGDSPFPHDRQTVGVRESQFLVPVFLDQLRRLDEFIGIESSDGEAGQHIEEAQELDRAVLVVTAQKPP